MDAPSRFDCRCRRGSLSSTSPCRDGASRSPRRDEAGLVWLRAEGESTATAESLRLQAFRRVADGIPMWVETRLSLEVSGKAREIELTGALLPGTAVVAVSGDLPARIDESGRLRIQVRAGTSP